MEAALSESWDSFREAIRTEFLAGGERFLRQPTITRTIHPDNPALARAYFGDLKGSLYGLQLLRRAAEPKFGTARRYRESSHCSMVALQHAWQLSKLQEVLGLSPGDLEWVAEIGGGYGDLCRQFRAGGFSGQYAIFDFPELQEIQRRYLSACDARASVLSIAELTRQSGEALLIGTFSLSEMPLEQRAEIEPVFAGFRYLMFSWNSSFAGIDNMAWFDGLAKRLADSHKVSLLKDPHMRGWYLFGKVR